MAKKKFRLQHVGFCKSCAKEIVNSDSFVIFADRTWYAVFWFNGEYEEFEEHDLIKVS